jgi:hypothetical protein
VNTKPGTQLGHSDIPEDGKEEQIAVYLVYSITVNTTIIIGYNWVYSDIFRLTRVIVRLSLEPVNVSDNYAYFGIPKCYNVYKVVTL